MQLASVVKGSSFIPFQKRDGYLCSETLPALLKFEELSLNCNKSIFTLVKSS